LSNWNMPGTLCNMFGGILGGTADVVNGVCTVTRLRNNLRPLIQGRRTNSALALAALFSFEDLDSQGNALNLGETVILQDEINPFISQLRMRGIEVTALHNHWLFDNPRLMYIHFKSVEPPLVFAQKVAAAFSVLTTRTVYPNRSCGTNGSRGSNGSGGSNPSRGSNGSSGCSGSGSSGGNRPTYMDPSFGRCTAAPKLSAKSKAAGKKTRNSGSAKVKSTVKASKPSYRTSTNKAVRKTKI
jgi:uncharacterized membrane protein YgcG